MTRASRRNAAGIRLRFDKVATRLIERLQLSVDEIAADGITVVVTITAPIRLAAKTAAELESKIRVLLDRGMPSRDQKHTIHGNHVRIRVLRHKAKQVPKLIGFVHNPDSDPLLLLNTTREWVSRIGTERRPPARSRLRTAADFKKILDVADSRTGALKHR